MRRRRGRCGGWRGRSGARRREHPSRPPGRRGHGGGTGRPQKSIGWVMRSIWRVVVCGAALVLWTSAAQADAILPPPPSCPPGSRPASTHAGPHCAPATCQKADDCTGGQTCRGVRLCVSERSYQNWTGVHSTRVIQGTCPDGRCEVGTCRTLRVCADPAVGAGGDDASSVRGKPLRDPDGRVPG